MADQQTEQKIAAYLRDLLARAPEVPQQQPQQQLEQKQEQDLKPQRGLAL
jgi:hypothetical protein